MHGHGSVDVREIKTNSVDPDFETDEVRRQRGPKTWALRDGLHNRSRWFEGWSGGHGVP